MSGREFAAAVQYKLPILAIVLDNGIYGAIRLSQEQASANFIARCISNRRQH